MKPVARLQAFGGGYIPRAVASEIEFRRQKRGLSQRQLAALVGRSQGQLANALRDHDPISARVVNRLRDALLT
jgi:transcriptional regulator with XRE-family HTH domain